MRDFEEECLGHENLPATVDILKSEGRCQPEDLYSICEEDIVLPIQEPKLPLKQIRAIQAFVELLNKENEEKNNASKEKNKGRYNRHDRI